MGPVVLLGVRAVVVVVLGVAVVVVLVVVVVGAVTLRVVVVVVGAAVEVLVVVVVVVIGARVVVVVVVVVVVDAGAVTGLAVVDVTFGLHGLAGSLGLATDMPSLIALMSGKVTPPHSPLKSSVSMDHTIDPPSPIAATYCPFI